MSIQSNWSKHVAPDWTARLPSEIDDTGYDIDRMEKRKRFKVPARENLRFDDDRSIVVFAEREQSRISKRFIVDSGEHNHF